MAFTTQMKVSADLKPDFIALRDALATLPVEEARAIVGAAITQARNPAPAEVPATSPQGTTADPPPTVAKIRAASNAELPRRRPEEPKPLEPGKILIVVRNEAMLAVHLGGKRYVVDARIQVSPDELQALEADLGQRKQWWGNHTRIERLEPA
jgi:hypothetical protein